MKATNPLNKTYVFDSNFGFVKAFNSKIEAVMKVRKKNCFFFSQREVKQQKHIKLFKDLSKFQSNPARKKALAVLMTAKKRAKK